jgi:hypothetical protein
MATAVAFALGGVSLVQSWMSSPDAEATTFYNGFTGAFTSEELWYKPETDAYLSVSNPRELGANVGPSMLRQFTAAGTAGGTAGDPSDYYTIALGPIFTDASGGTDTALHLVSIATPYATSDSDTTPVQVFRAEGTRLNAYQYGPIRSTATAVPDSASAETVRACRTGYRYSGEIDQKTGYMYSVNEDYNFTVDGAADLWSMRTAIYKFGLPTDAVKLACVAGVSTIRGADARGLNDQWSLATGEDYANGGWHVSSDMAIDANGNFYILLRGDATHHALVRLDVPKDPDTGAPSEGQWTYRLVKAFSGNATNAMKYGMAFHDGALYTLDANADFYRWDTLSGTVASVGRAPVGSRTAPHDLASAQTAPVIEGRVYNDLNGDGRYEVGVDDDLEGMNVEVYHNTAGSDEDPVWVKRGDLTTDSEGKYSALVNSATGEYIVRLTQPVIDNVNAYQTFARAKEFSFTSGGVTGTNTVQPYCASADAEYELVPLTAADADGWVDCYGARRDGTDPLTAAVGDTANPIDPTGGAAFVSHVDMNSSLAVVSADFGLSTAASWGDAPAPYATTNDDVPVPGPYASPRLGATNRLYLGDIAGVSAGGVHDPDANAHTGDDGLFVARVAGGVVGEFVPAQTYVMAANNTYRFRLKVSGDADAVAASTAKAWITSVTGQAVATTFDRVLLGSGDEDCRSTPETGTSFVYCTFTAPNLPPHGPIPLYARARVSSDPGVTSTSRPAAGATVQQYGEIEDYRTFIATSVVRMSAVTQRLADGPFTLSLSNVRQGDSWPTAATLTTTSPGVPVAFADPFIVATPGNPITVTRTAAPSGWSIASATCNLGSGESVPVTVTATAVTIPGEATRAGSDAVCTVTFTKAALGSGSQLSVTSGSKTADGRDFHEATALIKSDDDVPLAGQTVTFSLDPASGASLASSTCQTEVDGTCSVRITATRAASYDVAATVVGVNGVPEVLNGSPASVAFAAGIPNPTRSHVYITPGDKIANGTDYHTVRVELRDAEDNRVLDAVGEIIRTVAPDLGITISEVTALTGSDAGSYTFRVYSTSAGNKTVTVRFTDLDDPIGEVVGSFVADNPLPANSSVDVTPDRLPVGEVAVATATVADANHNPVAGIHVCFSSDPFISDEVTTCMETGTQGLATIDVTTLRARGYEISASYVDRQGATRPLGGSPRTVIFDPLDPVASTTTLTGTDAETRTTGGAVFHEATVTARDIHGNPVSGASVLFDLDGVGVLAPGSDRAGTTGSQGTPGTYSIRLFSPATTGFAYVSATFGRPGVAAATPVTGGASEPTRLAMEFVADTVDPRQSDFSLSEGTRVADGLDAHTITVTLRDANRTLVTGESGHLTVHPDGTGGIGTGSVGQWSEISEGVYRAAVTSTVWGVKTITVDWAGQSINPATPPGTATVEFVAGPPDEDQSSFTVTDSDQVADGTLAHAHTITVTLLDAHLNPVTDLGTAVLEGDAVLPGSDPLVRATVGAFTPTPARGVYVASVTSTVAGSFGVSVSLVDGGSRVSVVARGNDVAVFVPGDPGGRSSLVVDRVRAVVGETITATVTLLDDEGNPPAATTVTFWTSPAIELPNNGEVVTSAATGVAVMPVVTTRKGGYVLHAEYGTVSREVPGSPVSLTFDPGPPVFRANRTRVEGSTGDRLANGVAYHTATVTVVDEYENTIVETPVEFHVGGVGSVAAGYAPSGRTDSAGQLTVRIVSAAYVAGVSMVWAEVDGRSVTDGVSVDPVVVEQVFVTPGVASGSTYAVSDGTRVADGSDAHSLVVTLLSSTGTPVTGQAGVVEAVAAGRGDQGGAVVSGFVEGAPGVYSAEITSHVWGVKDVSVVWQGSTPVAPLTPPGVSTVEFVPDRYDPVHSGFSVSEFPNVVADGGADHVQTVSVHVGDAWANPISGRAGDLGVVAVLTTDPTIEATVSDVRPGANPGDYVADIRSTVAGTFSVSVTLDDADPQPVAVPPAGNTIAAFVPGGADPATSTLDITLTELTVGETTLATVTARDAHGNLAPGAAIHLWTTPALPGSGSWEIVTGAAGTAVQSVSTRVANAYALHAAIGASTVEIVRSPVTIVFAPGPVDPVTSELTIPTQREGTQVVADGLDTHRAQVHLRDSDGNDTPGVSATVVVTAPDGTAQTHLTPPSDADGMAWIDFSGTLAGEYTVAATVNAGGLAAAITGSPATAIMVPGPASTLTSTLTSTREFVEANAADAALLTLILFDAQSNPVGRGGDEVTFQTTHGAVSAATDQGDGTYTAQATASSAGNATVSFTVNGTASTGPAPRTVAIQSVATPEAPVPTYANATIVVGTAQAGVTIKVYAPGGAQLCQTTSAADGAFGCSSLVQPPTHGMVLTLTATEEHGFVSPAATVVADTEAPGSPTVNPTDGTEVTGSDAEPGSTVVVLDPDDDTVLCEAVIAADGTFRCGPLAPRPADEAPIVVIVVDPSDNSSDPVTVVVDSSPPDPPVVDPTDGSAVYGDAEPGSHVVVTDTDGRTVCEADADEDGSWVCEPDRAVNEGEHLAVTSSDAAGNVSTDVIVVADQSILPPPGVDPSNGQTIAGEGVPGYTVAVTFPDGTVIRTVVRSDGRWTITPPPGYTPVHADELRVVHEDQFNRVQVRSSAVTPLVLDRVAPDRPAPAPTGGGALRGTGEAGGVVIVAGANGAELGRVTAGANGTWTLALPAGITVGDLVTITVMDAAGNVSEAFSLRVGLIEVKPDRAMVLRGETIAFEVHNLQPSERSTGTVHSVPVSIGDVTGDADGAAIYTWTVPVDAEVGLHTFHVTGPFSGEAVSAQFQVLEPVAPIVEEEAEPVPQPAPLAKTGAEGVREAVVWTMAALTLGLFLLLMAARRRREAR